VLIVAIAKKYVDKENETLILTLGASCLVVPFLLFASHAGTWPIASANARLIGCKVAENCHHGFGRGGHLLVGEAGIYLLFAVLLLLGTQAAMFGTAKFGVLPEIVKTEKLSAANGLVD